MRETRDRDTNSRRPEWPREAAVEWEFFHTPAALLVAQGLERGYSCRQIGQAIGVTERTVQRWAKKYQLETPRNFGRKRKAN